MKTREIAHSIAQETIDYRRDMHQHAEVGFQEFYTTNRICEELDKIPYVTYRRFDPTGVMAEIKGTKGESSHIVAIRGDIDALNIPEKTGFEFASVNKENMHACGHDTHNAMLMGSVKVISQMRDEFAGTVRFIFQPSEENGEGALKIIPQGAIDNVDYIYGIHISSQVPTGKVAAMKGPSHAAADRYWIKITGKTSHGADPAHGIDTAVCGGAIISSLQTMVSREFDPSDPIVVTVGQIHAGTRYNIIPGYCEIEGTMRCYSREVHDKLGEAMTRIAQNIAKAYRCEAEVIVNQIAEVLVNDDEATDIGIAAIEKIAPGSVIAGTPTMGGEDFAWYTRDIPGAFFSLGARWHDESMVYPMHHECVRFEESALETGVAAYAQIAIDTLAKLNG